MPGHIFTSQQTLGGLPSSFLHEIDTRTFHASLLTDWMYIQQSRYTHFPFRRSKRCSPCKTPDHLSHADASPPTATPSTTCFRPSRFLQVIHSPISRIGIPGEGGGRGRGASVTLTRALEHAMLTVESTLFIFCRWPSGCAENTYREDAFRSRLYIPWRRPRVPYAILASVI